MEIQELILKRYGKFADHRIALNPGMNIIYGGNEMGKSTVHSFIRAMFFGLSRGRGRAAGRDEYQIRQPWDTPGAFLGSMRIREGDLVYRIDRCFDRSTAPLQLVCETTAEESSDPEGDLTALLGGISETAFVNTVFVSQAKCETDEGLARELQRFMVNSDSALDAGTDISRGLQLLRKKKKSWEQKKKKDAETLEGQVSRKEAKAEVLRAELELLRRQREECRRELMESRKARERESEAEEPEEPVSPGARIALELLLVFAGILALTGAFLLQQQQIKLYLGVFGGLFCLLTIPVHFLLRPKPKGRKEIRDGVPAGLRERYESLSAEIDGREKTYQKLQQELEALYQGGGCPEAEKEIAALSLAIDRICELASGIYEKSGGKLQERASEILGEITGGAYCRIVLDETMEIRIHTSSRVLGLHQVSGGTMQQIYFALRMAAGELLGGGKNLPVILDEPFAMYDESRLETVLRWLKNSGRQVILFTCQKREWTVMQQLSRKEEN